MRLGVVMVNGYRESNGDTEWYPKMFFLTARSPESFQGMGCAYESSFAEARRYGILPSDLRRGRCDVIMEQA